VRILIIGTPRSGTNTLLDWISKETDYLKIYEPYNEICKLRTHKQEDEIKLVEDVTNQNIVVKCLSFEVEKNQHVLTLFDKIIVIVRNNTKEQSESLWNSKRTNNWGERYYISPSQLKLNSVEISLEEPRLIFENNKLKEIGNSLQVTYEGVYVSGLDIERITNFINLETCRYVDLLSNNNKYRHTTNNRII
jgi:hypothetical protein